MLDLGTRFRNRRAQIPLREDQWDGQVVRVVGHLMWPGDGIARSNTEILKRDSARCMAFTPAADYVFRAGDIMLVMGSRETVDLLRRRGV